MQGNNVHEYTFKTKEMVVILDSKSCAKVDGEFIHVDLQLLLQRLFIVPHCTTENVEDVFKYELCNRPALFDHSGLPLVANKPTLADALFVL